MLHIDSSVALLKAAVRADSTFFVANYFYVLTGIEAGHWTELRREFVTQPATTVLGHCLATIVDGATALAERLRKTRNVADPSGCRSYMAAMRGGGLKAAQWLTVARRVLAREPDAHSDVWIGYSGILNELKRQKEAASALLEGLRRSPHAINTLALQIQLVRQHELMGDTTRATALRAAIAASVARDGRPYLRWEYLEYLANEASGLRDSARFESLKRAQIQIARDAGSSATEYRTVLGLAATRLDLDSDPKHAIGAMNRAVWLADSMGSRDFAKVAYLKRGRAFERMGEFTRAEVDLRQGLAVTAADDWYWLAEGHHYLTHVYEARSQWSDALREVDLCNAFATRRNEGDAIEMVSFYEAGLIRWKMGWHAAARASFESMLRVVDEELKGNYFFAGDYFERIGDFERATAYYRRGAAEPGNAADRPGNLAGLVRMFAALGMRDSARAAAARHDMQVNSGGTSRLLPGVLVADGRVDEAVRLAVRNVDEQRAKGSTRGVVAATVQLARVLLDGRRPMDALREAATAERRASAALTEETTAAVLLQGQAQVLLNSRDAIATLLRARAIVSAHPTAAADLAVESALGDAYSAFGQPDAALDAYARAATASQRVTATYESAVDRARSGDHRATLFDNALRMIIDMPPSVRRTELLLAWSSRKNDALFNHADFSGAVKRSTRLAELQRTLGNASALVNYVALDSTVFALVVTSRHAELVRLPVNASTISALVQRLRNPFTSLTGGALDLARAPFDLSIAHELYRGVFAMVEPLIGAARRVVLIPDGPLYGVPFNALPRALPSQASGRSRYQTAEYLIDRFTFTLSTSPAAAVQSARVPADARVLIIAGPVAGGERESASISAAWPGGRTVTIGGKTATEAELRQRLSGRSIAHFAVHARADESDALASHIELTRGGADDGVLHVAEVAALKFRGDLVVLTGCETLPGRVFAGTGPFGIAMSFIAGGARNVIATQWPVGESAADLSRDLHRALASGAAIDDALHAAQVRMRRDPKRAHPFYWGGYTLIAGGSR